MSILPKDDKARKDIPIYSGFIKYFPDAIVAVAKVSKEGNEQHNPGEDLCWVKDKSADHLESMNRHMIDQEWDKVAWRAMANLQIRIEKERAQDKIIEGVKSLNLKPDCSDQDAVYGTYKHKLERDGDLEEESCLRSWIDYDGTSYEVCKESTTYRADSRENVGDDTGKPVIWITVNGRRMVVYND